MGSSNDNNVKIFFKYGNNIIQLPVNPEEVRITTNGNNQSQEVVTLGEVNLLKTPKLSEVSIESFFPIAEAPGYVLTSGDNFKTPQELIDFFEQPFENKEPLYMVISGLAGSSVGYDKNTRSSNTAGYWQNLGNTISNKVKSLMSMGTDTTYDNVPKISITTKSIKKLVSIENFETWYGTDFDTYYKLDLKEFRNYGTRQYKTIIKVDEVSGVADAVIPSPSRQTEKDLVLMKNLKVATRAVKTVTRVEGMASKAVNEAKSTGQFIKTVGQNII